LTHACAGVIHSFGSVTPITGHWFDLLR
jgi:hypothetical protein